MELNSFKSAWAKVHTRRLLGAGLLCTLDETVQHSEIQAGFCDLFMPKRGR